jgi:hypothetical protein
VDDADISKADRTAGASCEGDGYGGGQYAKDDPIPGAVEHDDFLLEQFVAIGSIVPLAMGKDKVPPTPPRKGEGVVDEMRDSRRFF